MAFVSSLGPSRVNRLFRYTILISSASAIGPLLASFIVQYSRGGWVDYVWVCAALAGANTAAIYLLYPESNFNRPEESPHPISTPGMHLAKVETEKGETVRTEAMSRHCVSVVEKPWMSIWKTVISVDRDVNMLEVFVRPIIMLFRPSVLLAVFIYGTSLASQIIMM